jgi:hypothetical protein
LARLAIFILRIVKFITLPFLENASSTTNILTILFVNILVVEATGWVTNQRGKIELVRDIHGGISYGFFDRNKCYTPIQ